MIDSSTGPLRVAEFDAGPLMQTKLDLERINTTRMHACRVVEGSLQNVVFLVICTLTRKNCNYDFEYSADVD